MERPRTCPEWHSRNMVDARFELKPSVLSVAHPGSTDHPVSHWLPRFCKHFGFPASLSQLLLAERLSTSIILIMLICFTFSFILFVSVFIPIVLLQCHFGNRDKCLCSIRIFNWNFLRFLILSVLCIVLCFLFFFSPNTSVTSECSMVPRLPDRWSKIDKRISPGCPVHHSHGGT